MATSRSNRDVKMTLSVETLGQAEILALKNAVEALATEGGEAAPEFQALADQIGRLGQQSSALDSFKQLSAETEQLRAAQAKTVATTEAMGASLAELNGKTQKAVEDQKTVAAALLEARKASIDAAAALREQVKTATSAEKGTQAYKDEVSRLVLVQAEAAKRVLELSGEMTRANQAVREAEGAQAKLQKAYDRSAAAVQNQAAKLSESEAALAAAGAAAEELGTSTENLAQSEAELLVALQSVGEEAQQVRQRLADLVQEQKEQARATEEAAEAARVAQRAQDALAQSLADELALIRQVTESQELLDRALRERAESELAATRAAEQAAAAAAEMAENNRLLAIEQEGLNRLRRAGQDALDAETAAIREAEQAANLYIAEKRKQAEAEQEAATAARQAADTIADAFGKVGVRSAQELQREIDEVRAALKLLETTGAVTGSELNGAFAAGEARIKSLEREMRQLNGTLTLGDKAASLFKNSMGQIAAGNLVADAIASIVERVKEMGRQFIVSIVQLDQMRRGLNAVYQSALTTATQINFLRRTASEAGVAVGGLGAEFVRFSAAMNGAGIQLEVSNNLFKEIVRSSAALGLGAEATTGALNALGQMASKGTVSMEELRQQLGDRLPGALGLMAKGLGITQAELIKLVENGDLAARDAFPALTNALKELGGEATGLLPTWERLKGAFTEAAQNAGDSGWTEILALGLKAVAVAAATVVLPITALFEATGALLRTGGALAAAVITWTNPWEAITEIWGEADKRQRNLNSAFEKAIGIGGDYKASVTGSAEANQQLTQAISSAKDAADLQYIATQQAAVGSRDLAAQMVQYNVAAINALKTQQQQTRDTDKLAKAVKDEGEALVAVAKLRGDESAAITAASAAAKDYAAALARSAESKREEVTILETLLDYTLQNAKARGTNAEQIENETQKIEQKLNTAKAELEQSKKSAEAARVEAVARDLAVKTMGDQSAKIDELRIAYQQAEVFAKSMAEAEKRGVVTKEASVKANEALAKAMNLYKDARADAVRNEEMYGQSLAASNKLEMAGLELQRAQLKAAEDKARYDKNDFALRQTLIAQKQLEIKIINVTVASKIAEANAQIALLELKKKEIDINDPLYAQRVQSYDLSIKAAEASILQAKAQGESVAALERELVALKNGNVERAKQNSLLQAATGAYGSASDSGNRHADTLDKIAMKYKLVSQYTERQLDLLQREIDLQERRDQMERDRLKIDKEGFSTDSSGNRIAMGGDLTTRTGILNFLKSAGVDDEEAAKRITAQFTDGRGNIPYFSNPGQMRYGGDTISAALLRAAETYTFGGAGARAKKAEEGAQTSPNRDSSTNKTVTINIGGRSQKINVNSDADAQALTGILRQLETSANSSA